QLTDDGNHTATATVHIGPAVSITGVPLLNPNVLAGGTLQLAGHGGTGGPYQWTVVQPDASGGASIGLNTGLYKAGPNPGGGLQNGPIGRGDVVQATDLLGNSAQVQITVGPPLAVTQNVITRAPNETVALQATGG